MATAALTRYSPEEYLAMERGAETRSEYIDGRIVALAGAQRPHIVIVANLVRELGVSLLETPCEIYPTEMKVKIEASGRYVYPDLCVSCDPAFEDGTADVLLNPLLIVEVLSDSTESYDRGEKFFHYRRIASLREYVLVNQKRCLVERYVREGDFWRFTSLDDLDATLVLTSMDVEIPLRRIYIKALQLPVEEGSSSSS
ncbi:MAG TPA: Uma2 family endonuclease [Longimicrobium sp.]|nr:Uma2 family endonuclease [Longimicrobium sp.]